MILFYLFTLLLLSVYSYSQIDLNLTLFQASWFLQFKDVMINLGYYNRPLSAVLFCVFVIFLFIFNLKFKIENLKLGIIIVGILALLSYPFLSHDLFNYMFDAKIVTTYGQNPYFLKALDFPNDLWIRFMHWTHRVYPYGPVWLGITLIPSYLGLGKFVLTMFNFKLMFVLIYWANCYLVNKTSPKGLKFFALNPLIIIETVYSPHNEAMMLTFLLLGIYFYNKKALLIFNLLVSGGIKFLTIGLLPATFLNREKFIKLSLILISLFLFPVIWQREIYPWYLVTIIGLVALIDNLKLQKFIAIFSSGLLLRYIPYLYVGSYNFDVTVAQVVITLFVAVVSVFFAFKK